MPSNTLSANASTTYCFIVPIKGEGFNLLGDHFHPILVLLGPVWRLFPTPLALLIVQDILLAVSAWPITRLAMRTLTSWAGGALGLFYVLSWGFQGAVSAQFHEIAFAVPMLAWASAAFVERRWRACALWCAPLVLIKEDLGRSSDLLRQRLPACARDQRRAAAAKFREGKGKRQHPGQQSSRKNDNN